MTSTKGNIIVENIKIGDIHFEFDYNCVVKVKVITLPIRDNKGHWSWDSEVISENSKINGRVVHYIVTEGMSHYAPKLYDYEAYHGCKVI